MRERFADLDALRLELAGIAAVPATVHDRAREVLGVLDEYLPFDAAWLAVRDPERRRHTPLATAGLADPLRHYFLTPEADSEVERLGLNRCRPPMLVNEIPVPLQEVRAWAEHLLPAGFRGGLAAGLFTSTGRHVGFLSLLNEDAARPNHVDRDVVSAVTQLIADQIDRTREIAETARIVSAAAGGVVLSRRGDIVPLPGLSGDSMLTRGSPVLATAAAELAQGATRIGFLAPVPGENDRLVRVTALDCAAPDLDHLSVAVLVSPPGDTRGLGMLDLRLLGLVVNGITSMPAMAAALGVEATRVTDALGKVLTTLGADDITTAAVRALRTGLRIPPQLGGGRAEITP